MHRYHAVSICRLICPDCRQAGAEAGQAGQATGEAKNEELCYQMFDFPEQAECNDWVDESNPKFHYSTQQHSSCNEYPG